MYTIKYICHESSLCGSLRAPPEGSLTRILTSSSGLPFPQNPVPGTDHPYRCQSSAGLLKLSSPTHQCEVLFCPADNSKRYSCFDYLLPTWSVYPLWLSAACPWPRLPCVYSITCLPPASTLAFSPFTIQPFFDIPDAVTRSVPVWLVVPRIKLLMDPNATDSVLQYLSLP